MNKYKLIKTDDGSNSIYSEEFEQAMHSISGAWEESLFKHIYPSKILETKLSVINVLDVGFGMGYNSLALLYEINKLNLNLKVNITSFEYDNSYIDLLLNTSFEDDRDIIFKKLLIAFQNGYYEENNFTIKIIFGDARKSIVKTHDNFFDLVFQDPFSPGKNPELWSLEYFKEIERSLKSNGIITTYSSALHVRGAMTLANLYIAKGPSVGKKREGTLAAKNKEILENSIQGKKLLEITEQIKSTPYRDPYLRLKREAILQNRIEEMAQKRKNL